MVDSPTSDVPEPEEREWRAFRQAALLVGAVALGSVLLTKLVPSLPYELLLLTTNRPLSSPYLGLVETVAAVIRFVGFRVLPLLAVLLAFYLTSGRELPGPAVAAGAFLGGLLLPAGFVLADALVQPDATLLSAQSFYSFAVTTVTLVLPVVLAALLGAATDDLWERGARLRSLRG